MELRDITLKSHKTLIDTFGGSHGVRDSSGLDSALNRPFQTFDGVSLYKNEIQQAAALVESLVKNHPFFDGNKRIGYFMMRLFLRMNNRDILASQEEKYSLIINISKGILNFEEIKNWLLNHIEK